MSTSEKDYIETVENLLAYDVGLSHGWLNDYIQLSAYNGSIRKFAADLYRYTRNTPLIKEPLPMLYYLDGFLTCGGASALPDVNVDMNDLAEKGLDELLVKCCTFILRNTPQN